MRSLAEQAAYLEQRKKALGLTPDDFAAARNSGRRRTDSKKRLLQALAAEAKKQGCEVPFIAHY